MAVVPSVSASAIRMVVTEFACTQVARFAVSLLMSSSVVEEWGKQEERVPVDSGWVEYP